VEIIVVIPALIAFVIAFRDSPSQAFMKVYLPVLLLLPDYYRWYAIGLPDPTFSQATIIPILAVFVFNGGLSRWRWSVTDFLVLGYAFWIAYSEYTNTNYAEAQNLMFGMLALVVLPYMLAKGLIEPFNLRYQFARRVVYLMFIVACISVFEFRMGQNPFQMFWGKFFPWQGLGWVVTIRWGFGRISGPYAHAILAGIMFSTGYRLQRWLEWNNAWEPQLKGFEWLPLSKARIFSLGLLGGVLMTLCRGPWMGSMVAAMITAIGRSPNRKKMLILIVTGFVLVGMPAAYSLWSWASVGREAALTETQETAAYRKELIDKYLDIAFEHMWIGWGKNTWPKVSGMPSIDNYYLLLSLQHGLGALFLLWSIFLVMMFRLFRRGMQIPQYAVKNSLAFTLLGIYAAYFITIATVFMGEQTLPLFFIITGWADAYLKQPAESAISTTSAPLTRRPFHFRRVVSTS